MKTVAIIGFGRFGKTLYRLIKDDFALILYNRSKIDVNSLSAKTKIAKTVKEAYEAQNIFYCVPINQFASVLKAHQQYFRENHVLIDVLSVKLHAQKVFSKYLAHTNTQA